MSTFNSVKVKYNNDIHVTTYIIMYETYHVEHPFLCFIVYVVEVRMFVSHVSIKVELLELGEPAETKKAEDFLPEVVAEVAIAPNLLERTAVFRSGSWWSVFITLLRLTWGGK